MERRDFLKGTCSFCLLAGVGWISGSLESCSNMPIYKASVDNNTINVPVSLFTQADRQIIRPTKMDYDIALQKEKDDAYAAILLCCTHADNQLSTMGNGFVCNLHGSQFNKEGQVLKGPAERPLKRYRTTVVADQILIHLT